MTKTMGLAALVGCVLAGIAAGGEFARDRLAHWHHWRGPLANGTAPQANPPLVWDANKNIKLLRKNKVRRNVLKKKWWKPSGGIG